MSQKSNAYLFLECDNLLGFRLVGLESRWQAPGWRAADSPSIRSEPRRHRFWRRGQVLPSHGRGDDERRLSCYWMDANEAVHWKKQGSLQPRRCRRSASRRRSWRGTISWCPGKFPVQFSRALFKFQILQPETDDGEDEDEEHDDEPQEAVTPSPSVPQKPEYDAETQSLIEGFT